MDESTAPAPKRMRLAYHHRHKINHGQQETSMRESGTIDQDSLERLLVGSIRTICEEEGLKQNIYNPVIESLPLEALRNAAEEFMLQLCAKVRRSMLAARRVVPIAPDFETAFDVLDLPRPDDQLEPYQTRPRVNPPLLPTPPPDDPFHNTVGLSSEFLGPTLSKQDELKKFAFDTSSLPPLPSAHTYKDTAVLAERETDIRRIRELATEEGKLGEQALRKLATAVKLETALSTEPDARLVRGKRGPSRKKPTFTEEALFEETVRDLMRDEQTDFELGPIVTSEKAYRMPDDVRVKRRPVVSGKTAGHSAGKGLDLSSRYNVLPPPFARQASHAAASNEMDLSFEL